MQVGPRGPVQVLLSLLHGAPCAIVCPLGLQETSEYAFPEHSTICHSWTPSTPSHLCCKGAPQGHVSGVRICEPHSIPEQGHGG